jgi:hypothetical protein
LVGLAANMSPSFAEWMSFGPTGSPEKKARLPGRLDTLLSVHAASLLDPRRPFRAWRFDNEIAFSVDFRSAVEFEKLALPEIGDHRREGALAGSHRSKGRGELDGLSALVRRQLPEKALRVSSMVGTLRFRPGVPDF